MSQPQQVVSTQEVLELQEGMLRERIALRKSATLEGRAALDEEIVRLCKSIRAMLRLGHL